ncbi:MAG: nickel pincer cofactor biosynthesis protein LarB [Lentisphaerae bacterium]|nr:nickel pincer cofactor biosynthesis protein LarB [Lentisphaerota bacterium]
MRENAIKNVLEQVASGELTVEEALSRLSTPGSDLDFAKVDTDRLRRCGIPEVIYSPGKTAEQVVDIMRVLRDAGQDVLATRVSPEQWDLIQTQLPGAVHHETARIVTMSSTGSRETRGLVAVVCAGTSDLPVAEEAAITAETMGSRVERVYDVGIAGLHRLLTHMDIIRSAHAVVVVAGMEGALPSVVGGLIHKPIVAVPTSIGYGTNLGGVSALLAMLNSCVPGITVVNIDNGFGAGVAAAMINRGAEAQTPTQPAGNPVT